MSIKVMNLTINIIIICILCRTGIGTALLKTSNERIKSAREFMVQVDKEWIDVIKREAPRFGYIYKEKLVSNVYLFQEKSPTSNTRHSRRERDKNVNAFQEFFVGKIRHLEWTDHVVVKFYPRINESPTEPKTEFGRRILQSRYTKKSTKCWPYYEADVQEAWSLAYTGFGVKVAVVDTGIEIDHADLKRNIDMELSYSFVNRNHSNVGPERFPNYRETDDMLGHGTMAAGLIAGEIGNDVCSAGVAFDAKLIALKVFKPEGDPRNWLLKGFKIVYVPAALAYKRDEIDIYSCSFNVDNKFKAASLAMTTALQEGVKEGRNGKGSIYVFAAGDNRGPVYDCNIGALSSSIYTITISSVGINGSKPSYAIPCACTLASTYGEYKTHQGLQKLETTGLRGSCSTFTGTSASAALASGIFALTLQANPDLTWRDLQYITVLSSSFETLQNTDRRKQNSAGFQYDPFFGFGLINATAMVSCAKSWETLPVQKSRVIIGTEFKRWSEDSLPVIFHFENCKSKEDCVRYIEHAMLKMEYETTNESFLDIILCSPSKTCSYMLNRNERENSITNKKVKRNWNFTSVHFWKENPEGPWVLLLTETERHNKKVKTKQTTFISAELTLFGTSSKPYNEEHNYQQQTDSMAFNMTEWYDTHVGKILTELARADADEELDFVEETTKSRTTCTVVIILVTAILCVIFFLIRRRKKAQRYESIPNLD